jgi:hypothetical protein
MIANLLQQADVFWTEKPHTFDAIDETSNANMSRYRAQTTSNDRSTLKGTQHVTKTKTKTTNDEFPIKHPISQTSTTTTTTADDLSTGASIVRCAGTARSAAASACRTAPVDDTTSSKSTQLNHSTQLNRFRDSRFDDGVTSSQRGGR